MSHNLLIVTVTTTGNTSAEVRKQVASILEADPSFSGGGVPDNGYFFYSPLCDYFLLGGAWSGHLIGQDYETRYMEDGRDCDALPITEELYEKFLKQYEGQTLYDNDFVDLDREAMNPDFIGRKWICVVDYHQ